MSDQNKQEQDEKMQALVEELRTSFLANSQQRLETLDKQLDDLKQGGDDVGETLVDFLGTVHSLKGAAGTMGYPLVSRICHNLETYLHGVDAPNADQLSDVQAYIDVIWKYLEQWPQPEQEEFQEILSRLPQAIAAEASVTERDLTALIVSQNKSVAQIASLFLEDDINQVDIVQSAFEGFEKAITGDYDLLIVSGVLDGLSGPRLLAALAATGKVDGMTLALLSSSTEMNDSIRKLPQGVRTIATDHIEEDIDALLRSF